MRCRAVILALVVVVIIGLAIVRDRRKIDPGPGAVPFSQFSWNISAGDLLHPESAAARLGLYLDEIAAAGYRKQVRIILPPDWGPRIYEHWFPAIRARGFKVVAILGQERRDSAADLPSAIAWVRHILPLVRADLIAVQIVNEPAHSFTPEEYAAYHRQIAPLIRSLAPGVPIVAGDFAVQEQGLNTLAVWQSMLAAGPIDYDILSIHTTGMRREADLRRFAARLRAFCPHGRIWITEGDWGHLSFLRAQAMNVEEAFIYTWNDDALPELVRRPGGRLPS